MREVWLPIDGFPNYIVSNYGEIMNAEKDRRLHPTSNGGYMRVTLSNEDGVRQSYVHQLVAINFFDDFTGGEQIIHVNGDHTNNAIDNLYLRKRERPDWEPETMDREDWGRRVRIVETGETFMSVRSLAHYIRGDFSTVYRCLRGQRKTHRGYTFEYLED